jgi:hypothetical protein
MAAGIVKEKVIVQEKPATIISENAPGDKGNNAPPVDGGNKDTPR